RDYDRSTTVPGSAEEAAARFHTENLDAILDYAALKGIYIEFPLLVHSYWHLPLWWSQYKDNEKGYEVVDSVSDPDGAFSKASLDSNPVASYKNKTHRELLKALLTRLVKRYRAHPAVAIWGIKPGPTGENGYGPSYIAVRFNRKMSGLNIRTAMTDYSDTAKKGFQDWLKNKYNSIRKLNTSWGTGYPSFSKIEPPLPKKSSLAETMEQNGDTRPSMIDWQQFRYDTCVDEWTFLSATVRELDPDKLLLGHTSWQPAWYQTGSESMLSTAVTVDRSRLIDVDNIATGIVARDYVSHMPLPANRIDYANFLEFSRGYNIARIVQVENWVKEDPLTENSLISLERSIAVRDTIRSRGGYFWFAVALPHDQQKEGKPDWSWSEVENLVSHSKINELDNILVEAPPLLFYYDTRNLFSHYYMRKGGIRACRLYYQISKALFDSSNGQLQTGFISADQVADGGLSFPKAAKVLVMANQQFIPADICKQLKSFVSSGGRLVLIGSNGIFSKTNEKDTTAVEKLAIGLNKKQIERFFNWGIDRVVRVPFISITTTGTDYFEIPEDGDPASNFILLKRAMGNVLNTFNGGSFILERKNRIPFQQGAKNRFPASQQLQKNLPSGKCGDGICDEFEKRTGICRGDCLNFK
ncbi:MAG: glycosyl hydrolase family protein, partial [Candidatus Electrothrix sp. AUS1_2]|nr:glycosyl hydrolase family protein [Candidatus Electrothrix sp. AUS1_2]